jgi:hypothetical protein
MTSYDLLAYDILRARSPEAAVKRLAQAGFELDTSAM